MTSYTSQFFQAAKRFAERPCLEVDGKIFTYDEVDFLTDQIAADLGDRVLRNPVAICLPKGLEVYLAQIAVLKAGGFFVPIDPLYPEDRIAHMLIDSEAVVVISDSEFSMADRSVTLYVIDVPRLEEREDRSFQYVDLSGDDYAYMIYTSGSTGLPKGVPIHHRALLNHNHWCLDAFSLTPGDRILQFASISFDFSIEEIFPTFLAGATLLPAPPLAKESMSGFLSWVEAQGITLLNLPTAYWHELTHCIETYPLPDSVRMVAIGGEKVSADRVDAWFDSCPGRVPLYNAYGPTEATITSSFTQLEKGKPITIGRPIPGLDYEVLDTSLSPVEKGTSGELVIVGAGVAKGYWKRPELSAEKFITLPTGPAYRTGDRVRETPDGDYEFLGRLDQQVKINGFRIEPGEIEDAMLLHGNVSEALVLVVGSSSSLTGYFVADGTADTDSIKEHLAARLPTYMVPEHLVELDRMPITPGGKIDKKALPEPQVKSTGEARPPATAGEKNLVRIWESIFQRSDIAINDDFFALGGDSLKAIRLVMMIEQTFDGRRLPIATLAGNPTIETLAKAIEAGGEVARDSLAKPIITSLNPDSPGEPVFAFHGAGGGGLYFRDFEKSLENRHPFHIVESSLLYSSDKVEIPQSTVGEIGVLYADTVEDFLNEAEPVHLVGYSLGGLLAYEVGRILADRGYIVGSVINIDGPNPAVVTKNGMLHKCWKLLAELPSPPRFFRKLHYFATNQRQQIQLRIGAESLEGELRSVALENLYNDIEDNYRPARSENRMTLVCSQEDELSYSYPDDYGWSELVPPGLLEQVFVPGDHLSMMEGEPFQEVLKAFRSCFEKR